MNLAGFVGLMTEQQSEEVIGRDGVGRKVG